MVLYPDAESYELKETLGKALVMSASLTKFSLNENDTSLIHSIAAKVILFI